jgi:hypothetical protein
LELKLCRTLGLQKRLFFCGEIPKKIEPLESHSLKGHHVEHVGNKKKIKGKAKYWTIAEINNMLLQWQKATRKDFKQRVAQARNFIIYLPGTEIIPDVVDVHFYLGSSLATVDEELDQRDNQGDFGFTLEDPREIKSDQEKGEWW